MDPDHEGGDYNDKSEASGETGDSSGSDDGGRSSNQHSHEAARAGGAPEPEAAYAPKAKRICRAACCNKENLQDMEDTVVTILRSFTRMNHSEKHMSVMAVLSILMAAVMAGRRRGKGVRALYAYYLPLLEEICCDVFYAVRASKLDYEWRSVSYQPRICWQLERQNG